MIVVVEKWRLLRGQDRFCIRLDFGAPPSARRRRRRRAVSAPGPWMTARKPTPTRRVKPAGAEHSPGWQAAAVGGARDVSDRRHRRIGGRPRGVLRAARRLPADTGMGFVLVQHLDPDHDSALAKLLGRATTLPVHEVTDRLRVEPDHVYVIPPNRHLGISGGV